MENAKVSTRILLLVGALAVLVYGIGELGLYGITDSNEALQSVYEHRALPAAELGEIRALHLESRVQLNAALLTPSPAGSAERAAAIEANLAAVTRLLEKQDRPPPHSQEATLMATLATENARLAGEGFAPAAVALRANELDTARQVLVDRIRVQFPVAERALKSLIQFHLDAAQRQYRDAVSRYRLIQKVAITAVVSGLALAVLFGLALIRSLSRQLGGEPAEAAAVARAVAAGELHKPIAVRPGDQTSLMAQMKAMQEALSRVVTGVRMNSDSVAAASEQIAHGNSDLSERTEQQAMALLKTSSSIHQLSSTVARNAESASTANELARAASTLAAQGGEVVAQVVHTMSGINDSSKQIASIVGLIDGIAFQTNILALNAAVEAARAGEQGRGFAVVASEVRMLAQRSGQLAREIKTLIGASVDRVDQGTALVDRAGATMTDVVASIRRVSDIVTEISAASGEQRVGVGVVEEALGEIDRTTQQNAALVQQCAAAAQGLSQQAQALVEAVAAFTVSAPAPARS